MNLIGQTLKVLSSHDPTKQGVSGLVVLETHNTLVLDSSKGRIVLEKKGAAFALPGHGSVVTGDDLAGGLEDRLGGRSR